MRRCVPLLSVLFFLGFASSAMALEAPPNFKVTAHGRVYTFVWGKVTGATEYDLEETAVGVKPNEEGTQWPRQARR